jgi:4-amino-4-deoxy-L-arabinose transferase-like glycosyltransferase
MRYDEAVTYLLFVKQPWSDALSSYVYPNNHLFHTLLAKLAVTAFGNSPWALRLPALVAGLLLVPATYVVTRALYDVRAALIASAIVAASGVLTLYATNARGYSIVVLAFLLLILTAVRLLRGAPPHEWFTFAIIAALGLWTIPVMLYPLGTVSVWLVLSFLLEDRRAELRRLAIALGLAGGLTLLLYSPVISREGVAAITRNKFVAPSGWYDFLGQLPATFGEALGSWSLGIPRTVSLALFASALVALRWHATISKFRANIVLAAFVWSAWLLVVNHRAPFARVWLWLLPLAASLAASGIVLLLERWPRTRILLAERLPSMSVAYALAAALSVVFSFEVLLTRDTGTYRDAEEASLALRGVLQPGDRVLAGLPTNAPLQYYLDRIGVNPAYLLVPERTAPRIFVIVDYAEGQTLDRMTMRSEVRDTSRFTPPKVVATFSASTVLMYQRRDAGPK